MCVTGECQINALLAIAGQITCPRFRQLYAEGLDGQCEVHRVRFLIRQSLAEHTGKTAETVERDLERDYYMSAEEALEYGLIDKILKRGKNGENPQK